MKRDRGYRRQQRDRVIKNRKNLIRDVKQKDGDKADGEYAKRHPYDCGHPRCPLCSRHKVNKACASKDKDEHAEMELIIDKETHEELTGDMCDFGD